MDNQHCERDGLRVEVIAYAHVDDHGEPIPDHYEWDVSSNLPHCCADCGRAFDSWEEALNHLGETKVQQPVKPCDCFPAQSHEQVEAQKHDSR